MSNSLYKKQRILACFIAYFFCYLTFKNELYYEFILELALTSSSLLYHITEMPITRKIDVSILSITCPTVMVLSIYKNNYYPLFFNSIAAFGYFYKSVPGTMREHFIYVHIPALLSQFSSSMRLEEG